jgi:peptidoglycan-associated lipoprotein
VKENLELELTSTSPYQTQVKIKFKIMPYYDYKIGYLGTVKSNGYVEKNLFKRIQEILTKEELVIPPPPPPVEVEVEFALKDIFFDFDKYYIRPDAEPVLQENAEILKKNPSITVLIVGYADTRGTDEYNLRLALRRADATRAFLVNLGVDSSRITTTSGGETEKFAPGTTEEAYQLNRRAHFIPTKPGSMPGARIFLELNEGSKPTL